MTLQKGLKETRLHFILLHGQLKASYMTNSHVLLSSGCLVIHQCFTEAPEGQ
jgi:hypothetical protein